MHLVSTFYHFFPINDPVAFKEQLTLEARSRGMKGLIILSQEGMNATISGQQASALEEFKQTVLQMMGSPSLSFKDSQSTVAPFRRWIVKIRPEIVSLGTPELIPGPDRDRHLSPAQWNQVLKEEKDFTLIDTRNWYESQIGTFKGAWQPRTKFFSEFPELMEKQGLGKDRKVLIFCTGGIRCEKGILELQRQGFDNVYQLEGGILNYLAQFPRDQFEGECFVFDDRVALDQDLKPTQQYEFCKVSGQPIPRQQTDQC